ncbi:MAG TPA: nucleotidyltransferase family protein, partial [Longimicrobium sp.]|nr:nucleotidyltransferase family protein [Longimicrobium sp.]
LAARAQLVELAEWAAERGVPLVVLKGGVAAVTGEPPVGMADLDVLVPRETAAELGGFLQESRGYGGAAALPGEGAGGHHIPQRDAPGGIPVEVHRFLNDMPDPRTLIDRSRALGTRGLRRLAPADHLWYLVIHSTASHPERRGSLRDLALVARAWTECGEAEREAVLAQARAHRLAPVLLSLLRMACGVAEAEAVEDRFPRESAARCVLLHRLSVLPLSRRMRREVSRTTFALMGPPGDYRDCWAGLRGDPLPPGSAAARGNGRLARLPLLAWRAGRLGVATVIGAGAAAWAAQGVRRARAAEGNGG